MGEALCLPVELVEVRGVGVGVAVAGEVAVGEVVCDDDDDVGWPVGRCAGVS